MLKPLRLNLASGTDLKPGEDGWLNLDIVPRWPTATRGCDLVWDARKDRIPVEDARVCEVYAGYLLLHLAPRYHAPVLAEIRRVLAPDGFAVFGEVDMEVVMRQWLANPLDARAAELIWGEQGNCESSAGYDDFDKHCHGFTEGSLRHVLGAAGFGGFQRIRLHAVDYELSLRCVGL